MVSTALPQHEPERARRRWMLAMLGFVLVWAAAQFYVQAMTLVPPGPAWHLRSQVWIRFVFNLLWIAPLALVLRRRWLAIACLVALVGQLSLVSYFHYFARPLSLTALLAQAGEGLGAASYALRLIPGSVWLVLLLGLLLKLGFLRVAGPERPARGWSWGLAVACLLGYAGLFAWSNDQVERLSNIRTYGAIGRAGMVYGYAGSWAAEWYYLSDAALLERAQKRLAMRSDKLNPVEAPLQVPDRLVLLQVESLCFRGLDAQVGPDGRRVMPFLSRLQAAARRYRVRAIHYNGSADADFALLMGAEPSNDLIPYKVPGFTYEDALPGRMAAQGWQVRALHGVSGGFFSRRTAFEQMGFSELLFREELVERYEPQTDNWGVRDRDLLQISAQLLREAPADERHCHFVITVTSHGPFNALHPGEREIFPQRDDLAGCYIDNLRYVDRAVEAYVEALPEGTLLLIYGDHAANLRSADFESDQLEYEGQTLEYVPALLFQKGADLGASQRVRDGLEVDGNLSLIDIANYLRHQLGIEVLDETPRAIPE